jgi:hypothetical protein
MEQVRMLEWRVRRLQNTIVLEKAPICANVERTFLVQKKAFFEEPCRPQFERELYLTGFT